MASLTSTFKDGYLNGHLLLATSQLDGSCFNKAVIYVCAHTEQGAMGLVVNYVLENISCKEILQQLSIDSSITIKEPPVYFGGPVEIGKGFILHSSDYQQEETIRISDGVCLTSNVEILKDLVAGKGPTNSLLTLGYAGWGEGQLEEEIKQNSWLTLPATDQLLFDTPHIVKWSKAHELLGVNIQHFSQQVGNA